VQIDLAALPSDIDTLHRLVRDLVVQITGGQTELAQAQAEVKRLKLIIHPLQRSRFGRRSERLDADQLALGLDDLDADVGATGAHRWLRAHVAAARTARPSATRGCEEGR
jgi:transposase